MKNTYRMFSILTRENSVAKEYRRYPKQPKFSQDSEPYHIFIDNASIILIIKILTGSFVNKIEYYIRDLVVGKMCFTGMCEYRGYQDVCAPSGRIKPWQAGSGP